MPRAPNGLAAAAGPSGPSDSPRASDWKARADAQAREQAIDLELPSGMVIRARRPGPEQLAIWGRAPLMLATAAGAAAGGFAPGGMTKEDLLDIARFMREILIYVCLEPAISLDPHGEGQIHPRDIPDADLQFLFRWSMRVEEARALEGFRRQRGDVGGGGDSEAVRAEAIGVAGDAGSGVGSGAGPGGGTES